jgi:hypothetical protein
VFGNKENSDMTTVETPLALIDRLIKENKQTCSHFVDAGSFCVQCQEYNDDLILIRSSLEAAGKEIDDLEPHHLNLHYLDGYYCAIRDVRKRFGFAEKEKP